MATIKGLWKWKSTISLPSSEVYTAYGSAGMTQAMFTMDKTTEPTDWDLDTPTYEYMGANSSIIGVREYDSSSARTVYRSSGGWVTTAASGVVVWKTYDGERFVNWGSTEKTVPDAFYTWFTANADLVPTTYSISYNLSNCSASANNPTTIESGATVTLSFLAYGGYVLPDILTCSGASVVTWTGAGKEAGTLTIQNPTGNVTITVTATVKPKVYKRVGYYNDDVKEVALAFSNNKLSGAISLQGGGSIPIPETDLSSVGYTLPVATSTALGGVKVATKQTAQTESVGIGTDNLLYTKPITKVTNVTGTLTNGVLTIEISLDNGSTVSGTVNLSSLNNVAFIELGEHLNAAALHTNYSAIETALSAGKSVVLLFGDSAENEYKRVFIEQCQGMGQTLYFDYSGLHYSYDFGANTLSSISMLTTPAATTSAIGGIKAQTGSSDGQNFPVQVNADGTAFINIPIYNGEVI